MTDSDVHPVVRNAVVVVIWLTILVPVGALTIAVGAYAVRLGFHGDLTPPGVELGPQTQLLIILGLVGGYAFIVWVIVRETFGGDDVDEAAETALETAETAQEQLDE